MIGDGLNDSAAISLADIGVVMNESADISKQMSDVVLCDNNLEGLYQFLLLSQRLEQLVKRNV